MAFPKRIKAAIVPRDLAENDDIWGDPVKDQLLWPIGGDRSISKGVGYVTGEAGLIGESIRQFETIYWGRTGTKSNSTGATDDFTEPSPEPGEPTPTPTPVPTPPPWYIDQWKSHSVIAYNADGSEKWDGTAGVLSGAYATFANNSFAIRPALYVNAEAVTGGAEASPVIGNTVSFAGHEWYIIGTGIGGVTAPAGCYTCLPNMTTSAPPRFGRGLAMRTVRQTTTRTATCKKRWRELQTVLCQHIKITSLPVTRWTAYQAIHLPISFCGLSAKRNGEALNRVSGHFRLIIGPVQVGRALTRAVSELLTQIYIE